jgi:alkaline phosphatase
MPLRLRSSITLLLAMAATAIAVLVTVHRAGRDHRSFPVPDSRALGRGEMADLLVPLATNQAPRNVILVIGDGMGLGHLSAVSALIFGPRGGLAVESAPVTGLVRTSASNKLIPDSAAAGSAMATGLKTPTGVISTQLDGSEPMTLFEGAKAMGMATGFLTTSGIADATPATFLTHSKSRYDFESILAQILRSNADVLVGGTFERHRRAMRQPDYLKLLGRAESAASSDRRVVRSGAELASADVPVIALFPPRPGSRWIHGPPLVESVDRALELLAGKPAGFLLVIESEEIDEGSHANDLERVIDGLTELDAAVVRVLEFASRKGETLVIVTADHDTGGIAITEGDFDRGIAEVRWLDRDHLNTWVPLFAFGPGAARFAGVLDNTEIGRRIAELLGFEGFPPAS